MKRRALSAFQTGEFRLAQSLFKRIMEAEPGSPGARHNLAATYIAEAKYGEAEELLLDELNDFGEIYPRLRVLADLYYVSERRADANRFYRRALEFDAPQRDVEFLQKRIDLTSTEESYDRVRQAIERFMEGNRLMENDRWDEAISEFSRATDLDETNFHAMNNAGTIYMNQKNDPQQAATLFRRALRLLDMPWVARNLLQAEKVLSATEQGGKK